MRAVGKIDKGYRREINEDSIFIRTVPLGNVPNVFIVADGMGGHNAGEVASAESISAFCDYIERDNSLEILDNMISALRYSNQKVYFKALSDPSCSGMGTTFVAASVDATSDKLFIAHVGDSRLYIIRDDSIIQITTDHSYIAEMLKAGEITPSEAKVHPSRNVLTRAVGTTINVQVDGTVVSLKNNDIILICSDGLTNMLDDDSILNIVKTSVDLDTTADSLIRAANDNGGIDNISAILIEYVR